MRRRLCVEVFDREGKLCKSLTAGHLDACRTITILYESESDQKKMSDQILTEKIDHFNLIEGMITIHYTSGAFVEITRIFEP